MFENNIIPTIEFRLYYDTFGEIICYTCDKLEGNFIIIDAQTFAEARPDVKVVNGQIVKKTNELMISKLVVDQYEGINCEQDDICVITDNVNGIKWKLQSYYPYTAFAVKKIT